MAALPFSNSIGFHPERHVNPGRHHTISLLFRKSKPFIALIVQSAY
jgi:hypothetical protein